MNSRTLLGIYRERIFSPGKIQDDAAVMDATLDELSRLGWNVSAIPAELVSESTARTPNVLTMAQSDRALRLMEDWTRKGTRVVNSASSIRGCYRKPLTRLLQESGVSMPSSRIFPIEQAHGNVPRFPGRFWLKRGDVHAIQAGDVISVSTEREWAGALDHFRNQKVEDILIQEDVEGLVVKFYGVGRNRFFRAYSADTGEDISDRVSSLPSLAQRAAQVVGLDVYGGDAVLNPRHGVVLIDLNDWPSFSRCCRPAARSIADHLTHECVSIL